MAVGFASSLFVTVLVIFLSDVEFLFGEEFGIDLEAFVPEQSDCLFCGQALGLIAVEDAAAVLRA